MTGALLPYICTKARREKLGPLMGFTGSPVKSQRLQMRVSPRVRFPLMSHADVRLKAPSVIAPHVLNAVFAPVVIGISPCPPPVLFVASAASTARIAGSAHSSKVCADTEVVGVTVSVGVVVPPPAATVVIRFCVLAEDGTVE